MEFDTSPIAGEGCEHFITSKSLQEEDGIIVPVTSAGSNCLLRSFSESIESFLAFISWSWYFTFFKVSYLWLDPSLESIPSLVKGAYKGWRLGDLDKIEGCFFISFDDLEISELELTPKDKEPTEESKP